MSKIFNHKETAKLIYKDYRKHLKKVLNIKRLEIYTTCLILSDNNEFLSDRIYDPKNMVKLLEKGLKIAEKEHPNIFKDIRDKKITKYDQINELFNVSGSGNVLRTYTVMDMVNIMSIVVMIVFFFLMSLGFIVIVLFIVSFILTFYDDNYYNYELQERFRKTAGMFFYYPFYFIIRKLF